MKKILTILQKSPKFENFLKFNPEYDIISRTLSAVDAEKIQVEYPELKLFPESSKKVTVITLISRVLMQNGYPKVKAYIDVEKSEILHIFDSK